MANFLEGSAPALPKIFGTSGDVPSKACFRRLRFGRHRLKTGRGTRDEGRSKKWEGETSAEPKRRQRIANSEWRMVKRQIFWRAVLPHCRKFSAHQEMCPSALPKIFSAHQEMRPSNFFQPALEGFVLVDTDLKRVVGRGTRDEKNGRARLLPSRNGSDLRIASGEW
jgi:hypothetical protein